MIKYKIEFSTGEVRLISFIDQQAFSKFLEDEGKNIMFAGRIIDEQFDPSIRGTGSFLQE